MIKHIEVTKDDILQSKPLDSNNCALAKSLNRVFNVNNSEVKCDIKKYTVDIYFVVGNKSFDKSKIINYDEVYTFITCLDMGFKQGCKPFTFGIKI